MLVFQVVIDAGDDDVLTSISARLGAIGRRGRLPDPASPLAGAYVGPDGTGVLGSCAAAGVRACIPAQAKIRLTAAVRSRLLPIPSGAEARRHLAQRAEVGRDLVARLDRERSEA